MHLCFIDKRFRKYLAQTSPTPPMYQFVRAKGIHLYDAEGKAYIDLISGIAVNNLGHRNKKVVKAIRKQLKRYLHQMVYGEYVIGPQVELAERLCSLLPPSLNSVYLLNSGSEAIEGAIKLAKKASGRSRLVAVRGAYHGSTTGALSLMSDPYYSGPFKPLLPDVYMIDLNDQAGLSTIDHRTAAVFVEAIQAETAYKPATVEFLKAVRERCTEVGALMVCDEVQSGMGRTGRFCAFEHAGVVPDILTLAKGLGGGMPIGCFVASNNLMEHLADRPILGHITTFGGHPVSCVAASAAIDVLLEQGLMAQVAKKEELFRTMLRHQRIRSITGKGLMLAVHLQSYDQVQAVIESCYRSGLIMDWFLYENRALRIAPPLTITESEIKQVCGILIEALDAL